MNGSEPRNQGWTREERFPPDTRIVHVTTVPMTLGFLEPQVRHLIARGGELHIVSSPEPRLWAFGERLSVTVHPIRMHRRITPLRDLLAVFRLVLVLRRVQATVVHAHTPKGGLLGMLAGFLARTPVRIYHLRGLPFLGATGTRRRLLRRAEKLSCTLARRVIAVSRSMARIAVEEKLCAEGKIEVLAAGSGQGVDAEVKFNSSRTEALRAPTRAQLGIPEEARVIGFVGRIVRDKGIGELATAWSGLRRSEPDLYLLLVGPKETEDPVPAELLRELETDSRVCFHGEDWDTPRLYAAMDLVVLPSYREGFPNVPLEAAAMDLPVVASDVPGCTDAVENGVTGTLVAAGDAAALERALRRYLRDPFLARKHGKAGRERVVRSFRPDVITEETFRLYMELLNPERCPVSAGEEGASGVAANVHSRSVR